MSKNEKAIHADRTLVKPGTTPEELKQTAINMLKAITGKEPTPEDLANMDAKVARMERESQS